MKKQPEYYSNGTEPPPPTRRRALVIEALDAVRDQGGTIEDIVDLIGGDLNVDNPKMSVGGILSRMEADNLALFKNGRWYSAQWFTSPVSPNGGNRAQVAPLTQKRSGRTVAVYSTPRVRTDVIAVALLINERWYKIPLLVDLRVCIGYEAPIWSPEQEVYSDVAKVRITLKNGTVEEETPARTDLVTIAAAE
jgi:hypothetical protein